MVKNKSLNIRKREIEANQRKRMPSQSKRRQFAEPTPKKDEDGDDTRPVRSVRIEKEVVGSSGTRIYSGYISEEYLSTLQGYKAADVYDKMRRQESQVKMALSAVKNPILKAVWDVEAVDSNVPEEVKIAEFCKHALMCNPDKTWKGILNEALSSVMFGYAAFERSDTVVTDDPEFGTFNGVNLGWRSQRTIHRFNVDKATGRLTSISQYAFGDLQRTVDIPADSLILISIDKEGDNYEGISCLRPAYGPYLLKQTFKKLLAIGVEKFAVPTAIGRIPEGKQNTPQAEAFKQALEIYTSHEANYITLPSGVKDEGGWDVEFNETHFDPEKVQKAIDAQDREIVKAFIAGFLELGQSSSSGSWALSFDQSDFFLSSIEHIADLIAEVFTELVIKRLVLLNFGPRQKYPTLKYSGISDEAGKELAETLKALVDGKIIVPDDDLEDNVRKRYKLPKKSDKGQREVNPAPAPGQDPNNPNQDPNADPNEDPGKKPGKTPPPASKPKPPAAKAAEVRLALAEKRAKKQIAEAKETLLPVMQESLKASGDKLVQQIMASWRALPDASKSKATKDLELKGAAAYKNALIDELSNTAGIALKGARAEVPKAKDTKLGEVVGAIKLADPISIDDLPAKVRQLVRERAALLSESTMADLQKAVFFRFASSVNSTDSASILESDLDEVIDDFIASSNLDTAASNSAAHTVNEARNAFFFDDDVLEEIESFTFVNGDPVSPICQDLAGQTFAKDDPEAARYFPPLHHNCKSYIVANPVGGKRNPAISDRGLKPSSPDLDKYVTLSEHE